MAGNGDTLEARIRAEILAYVAAHPRASDTAEGIVRWWVGTGPLPVAAVASVLDRLAEEGRLVRTRGADGKLRYAPPPPRSRA